MFACRTFGNSEFPLISTILTISNQKPLSLRYLLIKISFTISDKKTIAIDTFSKDSPTNESMFPM